MISNLEEAGEFVLKGWALYKAYPSVTVSLDVFVNRKFVARVPAATFRSDLASAGYGDGYHAFFFNPFDFLYGPKNLIEVREASSSRQINGGQRIVETGLATNGAAYRQARLRSQARWKTEAPANHPEGELAFLRRLLLAAHFHPGLRILEVGAGTGETLRQIVKRKKPFSSYLGLDLSRPAIESLHDKFANKMVQFLAGDAARYPFNSHFDLVFASSVCDTLFPSFLPLLKNISRVLPPGGLFAFDLLVEDDRASISRAAWNENDYSRLYSQAEVRRQLAEAGMEMMQGEIYEKGIGQHRIFITAFKLPAPSKNKFEI